MALLIRLEQLAQLDEREPRLRALNANDCLHHRSAKVLEISRLSGGPVLVSLYDPVRESVKRPMVCLRCGAELIPIPEPQEASGSSSAPIAVQRT